jgi:hypothetical protein
VTFLGAVHWGLAMATPLTSHIAVRLANESFVYSVIPSLVAWPIALMEPGALGATKVFFWGGRGYQGLGAMTCATGRCC